MEITCKFGEDIEGLEFCDRFYCECNGEAKCEHFMNKEEHTKEELEIMNEMAL